jgi:hypothetical protein
VTSSHSECSAGKLIDQEQFLYFPVLKCVYLLLANKFLLKKKKTIAPPRDTTSIFDILKAA